MKLYAMTGGATGIGAALREQLTAAGHQVISIDIKEGDIIADLSTPGGRASALAALRARAADGLDGFIACAGLPPVAESRTIAAVNYFGAVDMATGLQDLLGHAPGYGAAGEFQLRAHDRDLAPAGAGIPCRR